jgi:hypothetical protein
MARFTGGGAGSVGPQGLEGPMGQTGADGPMGMNGVDGLNGLSAYEVAVNNGFSGSEQEWLDSIAAANIADFSFDLVEGEETLSRMTIHNHDMVIRTTSDSEEDSDIEIVSADDARVTAEDIVALRAGSHVAIRTGWDSGTEESDYRWEFSDNGQIQLPGNGYIDNQASSSGDGNGYSTIKIVPDSGLETDQYLIVDPTEPSHIHIRAGGEIDESSADLILGGEKTNVKVSDFFGIEVGTKGITYAGSYEHVGEQGPQLVIEGDLSETFGTLQDLYVIVDGTNYPINGILYDTEVFPPTTRIDVDAATFMFGVFYEVGGSLPQNTWHFDTSGVLNIPKGISSQTAGNLKIESEYGYIVLDGLGAYLYNDQIPQNQIATIGDTNNVSYKYVLAAGLGGPGMSEDLANNPTFSIPGPFGAYVVGNYVRYYPNPQLEPTAWVEGEITSKTGDESLTITVGNWSVLALGIGGASGSDEIRPYMTLAANPSSGPRDINWQVAGGTLGTQPTFNGDPLFSGSYVRTGSMVHFRIDVDFDNITSFGTGQYYLNLPFNPKYNYMFTGGCLHDFSSGITYVITGHVFAGNPQMRLESTDNSGNSSFNIPFTATAPITLQTADNFHVYGDYIAE